MTTEPGTEAQKPRQRTVAGTVQVEGIGLMLGQPVKVEIKPAPPETGIVFERVDLDPRSGSRPRWIGWSPAPDARR